MQMGNRTVVDHMDLLKKEIEEFTMENGQLRSDLRDLTGTLKDFQKIEFRRNQQDKFASSMMLCTSKLSIKSRKSSMKRNSRQKRSVIELSSSVQLLMRTWKCKYVIKLLRRMKSSAVFHLSNKTISNSAANSTFGTAR